MAYQPSWIIHSWDKEDHTFTKSIIAKVNVSRFSTETSTQTRSGRTSQDPIYVSRVDMLLKSIN